MMHDEIAGLYQKLEELEVMPKINSELEMKIESSVVNKLTITGVPRLDAIAVFAEDIEPGKGENYGCCVPAKQKGKIMSVVPYFFVRCKADVIASIESSVREIDHRLQFERTEIMEHSTLPKPLADEAWFLADMRVGAHGDASESEIAKRLYSLVDVLELRWTTDMAFSDAGITEIVTKEHRLITNSGLECQTACNTFQFRGGNSVQ